MFSLLFAIFALGCSIASLVYVMCKWHSVTGKWFPW